MRCFALVRTNRKLSFAHFLLPVRTPRWWLNEAFHKFRETSQTPHINILAIRAPHPSISPSTFDSARYANPTARLQQAHGEEVVRDIWFSSEVKTPVLPSLPTERPSPFPVRHLPQG